MEAAQIRSTQGGAIINPKVPLLVMAVLNLLFGVFMVSNPIAFLKQYSLDFSDMNQTDEMMCGGFIQQWGIWNMMLGGFASIAARVASERTRMHLNVAGALSVFVNALLILAGFGAWTSLGTSVNGLAFNLLLSFCTMILFGLGAGIKFELAPCKKPIYWMSCAMAMVGCAYLLMFLFFPVTVLNGYHVTTDNDTVRMFLLTTMQYGWSGTFFTMTAWFVAVVTTTDFMYVYALNRWVAVFTFANVLVGFTNVAWWTTKNGDGHLDSFIFGQSMNCLMNFIFAMLAYGPVMMLDNQVAESVKNAIGGQVIGGPTLLAPSGQQQSDYKAPLVGQ